MLTFNSPKRPVGVSSSADVYTLAVHSRHRREITANEMTSNEIKLYRDGSGPELCIVRTTEMSAITGCNRRAKWTALFPRRRSIYPHPCICDPYDFIVTCFPICRRCFANVTCYACFFLLI